MNSQSYFLTFVVVIRYTGGVGVVMLIIACEVR